MSHVLHSGHVLVGLARRAHEPLPRHIGRHSTHETERTLR